MAGEPHIMIVDDDAEICQLVRQFLVPHVFRVAATADGQAKRGALAKDSADLVILDLMLPGEDGLTRCRQLRAAGRTPIIFLTAVNSQADRVVAGDGRGRLSGEALARARAVLRRAGPPSAESTPALGEDEAVPLGGRLRFSGWTLDIGHR